MPLSIPRYSAALRETNMGLGKGILCLLQGVSLKALVTVMGITSFYYLKSIDGLCSKFYSLTSDPLGSVPRNHVVSWY